jgi:triacylglycerol lipase
MPLPDSLKTVATLIDCANLANIAYTPDAGVPAALIAYDPTITFIDLFVDQTSDTHGFCCSRPGAIYLGFPGTSDFHNIITDVEAWPQPFPVLPEKPWVHHGFADAYSSIRDHVRNLTAQALSQAPTAPVIMLGHSLGGALATLAASDVADSVVLAPDQLSCVTFGSPRVGLGELATVYNGYVPNTVRVVHADDLIPKVPSGPPYQHVAAADNVLIIQNDGTYVHGDAPTTISGFFRAQLDDVDGQALKNHLLANYLAALKSLPPQWV